MKILVLNAGSSSLKYALFKLPGGNCLLGGLIDKIGFEDAHHRYQLGGVPGNESCAIKDHAQAFDRLLSTLSHAGIRLDRLNAIAHRVVHGGEYFHALARIGDAELLQLKRLNPIAPLHNPANILGIESALKLAPHIPQIAVFDTAFHHSLPDFAYRYPVPEAWYQDYGVRRYGFHGTSHQYVAKQAASLLGKPLNKLNLISLHLGNGASVCAIQNGKSIDTSMGFSPLEGLMMGTRCGDIDASVCTFMAGHGGLSMVEIDEVLNHHSGLKGIAASSDMRELHDMIAQGDQAASLAFKMFCYRVKKYIGAYAAVLGRVDALIFTGGIGENDPIARTQICTGLKALGLALDKKKNAREPAENGFIQRKGFTPVLLIKTDEALEIARQASAYLKT